MPITHSNACSYPINKKLLIFCMNECTDNAIKSSLK